MAQHIHPLVRLTLIMSGIFVAVMALLIVAADRDTREAGDGEEPAAAAIAGAAAPVESFLAFAEGRGAAPVGLAHEYAAQGIVKLSAALEALSGDPDRLADFRLQADRLQRDTASLEHADIAREVLTSAASMLGRITGNDLADVRAAAETIDPDRPLLPQADAVRHFFRSAAGAMRDHAAAHDVDVER